MANFAIVCTAKFIKREAQRHILMVLLFRQSTSTTPFNDTAARDAFEFYTPYQEQQGLRTVLDWLNGDIPDDEEESCSSDEEADVSFFLLIV